MLGPLLVLLFINDLPNASRRLKFYLLADDTNIYYGCDAIEDLTKKVNNELKYVKRWLDTSKLSLNISRINYIIFHSSADSIQRDTRPSWCLVLVHLLLAAEPQYFNPFFKRTFFCTHILTAADKNDRKEE